MGTVSVDDVLPPLPPSRTKDRAFDKLVTRLERGDAAAIDEFSAAATAKLLARLAQATAGIAALQDLPAMSAELVNARQPRQHAIRMLARALARRLAEPGVEDALVAIVLEHPWHEARVAAGWGLLTGAPSRAALERIARVMDDESLLIWVRHVGIAAAVRADPATAFDRLAPRFEPLLQTSEFPRGLYVALSPAPALAWPPLPIDPRWFPLLARGFEGKDSIGPFELFKAHPEPAAVRAVRELVERRTRARAPWLLYVGFTLMHWKKKETAAVLVRAVQSAARASDERLTGPLSVLEEIGDASVVPRLRGILKRAAAPARPALLAAIAKLAPVPPRAPAANDDPLAARFAAAGFGAERVAQLVALARPRVTADAKPAKRELPIGKSRLGGLPDLPRGTPWPMHGDQPLAFVAQIDLAELAPLDEEQLLPRAGWLAFFVRQDLDGGDRGYLFGLPSRVLFFEGSARDLRRAEPPPDLAAHDRHRAATIAFARDRPPPPPAVAYRLDLVLSESRAYDGIDDDADGRHQLLGHARAAYYLGLPRPGETLLLQLATDSAPRFMWGDASSIFFVIADAALAARRFDDAYCVADEC